MTNTRFREVTEGMTVEMIATRIELAYVPAGAGDLTAIWWGREHIALPDGHEQFGTNGDRLETRLSDWATTTRTIWDPVLQEHITLSAMGWVEWGKNFYDHAHNVTNQPVQPAPPEEPEE